MKNTISIKGSRINDNIWSFNRYRSYFDSKKSIKMIYHLRSSSKLHWVNTLVVVLNPLPFTKLALAIRFDKEGNYKRKH